VIAMIKKIIEWGGSVLSELKALNINHSDIALKKEELEK